MGRDEKPMKVLICVAEGPEERVVREIFPELKLIKFGRTHLFDSEKITLLRTGRGRFNVAMALTEVLTISRELFESDFAGILNYGAAASADQGLKIGDIYTSLKIIDNSNKLTFYPEVYLDLPAANLLTLERPLETELFLDNTMIDMEGAAICSVAEVHHSISRVIILKLITDHGKDYNNAVENFNKFTSTVERYLKTAVLSLLDLGKIKNLFLSITEDRELDAILITNRFTKTQRERIKVLSIPKLRNSTLKLNTFNELVVGQTFDEVLKSVKDL